MARSSRRSRGGEHGGAGNDRRGTKRPNRRSSSTSPSTPLIIGGVLVIVVGVVVAVAMNSSEDESPSSPRARDFENTGMSSASREKSTVSTPGTTKSTPASKPVEKTSTRWREMASKVDMSSWKSIEKHMLEATRLRTDALAAQKAGEQKKFESLITRAVKEWRKGDQVYDDLLWKVSDIHEDLWDKAFKPYDKKLARWNRMFRGYLQYENR